MGDAVNPVQNIEVLLRSHYPLIYIVSSEEQRVVAAIQQVGRSVERKIYHWSCLAGLTSWPPTANPLESGLEESTTADPVAALKYVLSFKEKAIFVFKDFHQFLAQNNPELLRLLREAAQKLPGTSKTIILTGPSLVLPFDLEKEVAFIDFPLPGPADLGAILDSVAKKAAANPELQLNLGGGAREEIVKATNGLTLAEARNVFTKSLITKKRLGLEQIDDILEEKCQIIRKSGFLEYYQPSVGLDEVGGLDNLKRWLDKRTQAFSSQAQDFGLPAPRGVLLLGVQGCGKSVSAKAIARQWNLPLLRLDLGRIFDAKIGGSEENMRRAIALAERIAPCILWIDEIDKAFGGGTGESGDGGTARRVLATFLTWMGEKTAPVFVAATANNIAALPSELLRKGRFDEIFFVDLPGDQERQNILAIHISRRGRNPADFDLLSLVKATDGFSGAEIEQAVIAGLFNAFYEQRELTGWDITMAASETVPLSKTMQKEIDALRQWCHTRTRPASESRLMQVSRLTRPSGAPG